MNDDNIYKIEEVWGENLQESYYLLEDNSKKKLRLKEEQVRKLASQLLENTEQDEECICGLEYVTKECPVHQPKEQQKVSDCCGADTWMPTRHGSGFFQCKSCGEPCDAVEPDEKIEKIKAITDRNLYDKINEIIEKINNE